MAQWRYWSTVILGPAVSFRLTLPTYRLGVQQIDRILKLLFLTSFANAYHNKRPDQHKFKRQHACKNACGARFDSLTIKYKGTYEYMCIYTSGSFITYLDTATQIFHLVVVSDQFVPPTRIAMLTNVAFH